MSDEQEELVAKDREIQDRINEHMDARLLLYKEARKDKETRRRWIFRQVMAGITWGFIVPVGMMFFLLGMSVALPRVGEPSFREFLAILYLLCVTLCLPVLMFAPPKSPLDEQVNARMAQKK